MDLQFLSVSSPSSTVLFLFLFIFIVLKIVISRSRINYKLPPGPWQLPIIGSLHHLIGSDIHHILRDLSKKYGPLMYLRLGEIPTVIISSAEIAKEVLKTNGIISAQRPQLVPSGILPSDFTSMVFSPYGDYLLQVRKICAREVLSPKRIQTFRSIREEAVLDFIKEIDLNKGSVVNLSNKIFCLIHAITSKTAFGKESKDQKKITTIVEEFGKSAAGFSLAAIFPSVSFLQYLGGSQSKLKTMFKELHDILEITIKEHREKETSRARRSREEGFNHEDLLDVLLRIQNNRESELPLTDNNISGIITEIFGAGIETSFTTVEWAMSEMLKDTQVMRRAQAEVRKVFGIGKGRNADETRLHELKYLHSVIKETLRIHPPGPLLIPRESSHDIEINGYVIPAKTRVFVNAWAISRDPKYWTEPEKFNPDRFLDNKIDYKGADFEFIPFGAGRRVCPGILLAMANIQLILAQLVYHFDWQLPVPESGLKKELDMTETFGLTLRRKNDLYVIPVPPPPPE